MKAAPHAVETIQSASLSAPSWLEPAWRSLHQMWDELQSIDPRTHESLDVERVSMLRQRLCVSLAAVAKLASDLMARCDHLLEAVARRALPASAASPAVLALSDVCFIALAETNGKRAELERHALHADPLRSLCVSSSALRRARKVLTTMDAEIARTLGEKPGIDASGQLAESIEIRKQYGILRRTAEAESAPRGDELRRRLRAIEMRISMLREREIYPRLRLDDRVELSVLRQRLLRWLDGAAEPTEGLRLWQDAVGFTHVLTQVNHRQELREHDASVVRGALAALDRAATLDGALWESLKGLLGLHDGLDDALRRDDRDREGFRLLLRALDESLAGQRASGDEDDLQ